MYHYQNDSISMKLPYILIDTQNNFNPGLLNCLRNMIRSPRARIVISYPQK